MTIIIIMMALPPLEDEVEPPVFAAATVVGLATGAAVETGLLTGFTGLLTGLTGLLTGLPGELAGLEGLLGLAGDVGDT